jgi:hypothetical protein
MKDLEKFYGTSKNKSKEQGKLGKGILPIRSRQSDKDGSLRSDSDEDYPRHFVGRKRMVG